MHSTHEGVNPLQPHPYIPVRNNRVPKLSPQYFYTTGATPLLRLNLPTQMLPAMDPFKPYTYIQCPCSTTTTSPSTTSHPISTSSSNFNTKTNLQSGQEVDDDDEQPFDPQAPRAPYTLYPPAHLLYCEDCGQIRCPRCVLDEIVTWYCPNCLFEVPAGTVRGEGNKCVFILDLTTYDVFLV